MNKIISFVVPAVVAVAAFAPFAQADTAMTTTGAMMDSSSSMMDSSSSMMAPSSDLSFGSRGSDVSTLQTWLIAKGFLNISTATGYFGPLTQAALIQYQTSVGLPAHGYYGALTRAKVTAAMSMNASGSMSSGSTSGSMSSGDSMSGSASTGVMVGGALMTPDKDIVQNAVNANNVTTLVAAVKAAGLVATLETPGPFTVFAPTNDAFAKLPAGTVSNLLLPANLAMLKDILTYHVVAGRYTSADLYDGETLTTVEGKKITIGKTAAGVITVNGVATVQTKDVISSNGVTFVIDTVLTPPTQ